MDQIPHQYQEGSRHNTKTKVAESEQPQLNKIDVSNENEEFQRSNIQNMRADINSGKNAKGDVPPTYSDAAQGEVNMEVSISADDVVRAGGFGARDDMSSCFPVASDFTDFEASLLDARDYEEPQQAISRPGLGWTDSEK